jgi:hypothetical protein
MVGRMAGNARHSAAEEANHGSRPSLPADWFQNGHQVHMSEPFAPADGSGAIAARSSKGAAAVQRTRKTQSMKQSTLADIPVKADVATPSARSAIASAVSIALLLLTTASCGFPRPPDLVDDAPGGSDGPVAPIVAIHVSPSGDDSNDGFTSPVRTLKHAIGLAAANTRISEIVLATGTYSMSSGETFPYTVPPNVTIVGPAGGGALLSGSKVGPGMTVDIGGLQDLDFQDFTTAIAATGTASLKNIRVVNSAIAVQAETAASVSINNLDITGAAATCATGIVLNGNAVLTSSALATRALGTSLLANDHSTATLSKVTVTSDSSCTKIISVFYINSSGDFSLSDSVIDGGSRGIEINSPYANVPTQATLENVLVRNVDVDALAVANATVQVTGGELSHMRQTSLEVVGGSCSLTNVSILSSGAAFYVQDATLRMRGCMISNNTAGGDLGVRSTGDLGTTSDPGNNIFSNAGIGLLIEGGNGTQLMHAVGNTWKPVQGADSNGKYVMGTVVPGPIPCDSNSGNFCIQVSDESLEL